MFVVEDQVLDHNYITHVGADARHLGFGRFLQVDPVGYKDAMNLYSYVSNDPVDRVDPTGLYECSGSPEQCGALKSSYERAEGALSSDKLSKGERAKLQSAVNVLGAPGKRNGVNISFASEKAISTHEGGHSANGYTEQMKDGSVHVTLRGDFGSLYSNYPKQALGRDL